MNKKELIDKLTIYQDDFLSHQIIHLARQAEGDDRIKNAIDDLIYYYAYSIDHEFCEEVFYDEIKKELGNGVDNIVIEYNDDIEDIIINGKSLIFNRYEFDLEVTKIINEGDNV